jgi:hypothetical protein
MRHGRQLVVQQGALMPRDQRALLMLGGQSDVATVQLDQGEAAQNLGRVMEQPQGAVLLKRPRIAHAGFARQIVRRGCSLCTPYAFKSRAPS